MNREQEHIAYQRCGYVNVKYHEGGPYIGDPQWSGSCFPLKPWHSVDAALDHLRHGGLRIYDASELDSGAWYIEVRANKPSHAAWGPRGTAESDTLAQAILSAVCALVKHESMAEHEQR